VFYLGESSFSGSLFKCRSLLYLLFPYRAKLSFLFNVPPKGESLRLHDRGIPPLNQGEDLYISVYSSFAKVGPVGTDDFASPSSQPTICLQETESPLYTSFQFSFPFSLRPIFRPRAFLSPSFLYLTLIYPAVRSFFCTTHLCFCSGSIFPRADDSLSFLQDSPGDFPFIPR